jgi:hypothetical protein
MEGMDSTGGSPDEPGSGRLQRLTNLESTKRKSYSIPWDSLKGLAWCELTNYGN